MTVLLADPEIAAVPVRDEGERLVPIPSSVESVAGRPLVRQQVAERLALAALLLPPGRRLQVAEGHRSPTDQQAIWDHYASVVTSQYPAESADEQRRLTSRFVSPLEVAPHVAGAAVDVTLVDRLGGVVDMGTPIDATPEQSEGACWFDAPVGAEARHERTLLARALGGAGFVNYPTEWWHWSFGDRYWAWANRAPAALYGPCELYDGPSWRTAGATAASRRSS